MTTSSTSKARLKRSDLKTLIKECLYEIITEDFIGKTIQEKLIEVVASHTRKASTNTIYEDDVLPPFQPRPAERDILQEQYNAEIAERMNKYKQTLNSVYSSQRVQEQRTNPAKKMGEQAANVLGIKDNVMRSIFEDTAQTTVRKQREGPHAGDGHDPGIDISTIFNPEWAKMAGL